MPTIIRQWFFTVRSPEQFQAGLRGSGYRWRDGSLRKMKVGIAICILGGDVSGGSRYHYERAKQDGSVKNDEINIVGNVEGLDCIIVDDMIASGGKCSCGIFVVAHKWTRN